MLSNWAAMAEIDAAVLHAHWLVNNGETPSIDVVDIARLAGARVFRGEIEAVEAFVDYPSDAEPIIYVQEHLDVAQARWAIALALGQVMFSRRVGLKVGFNIQSGTTMDSELPDTVDADVFAYARAFAAAILVPLPILIDHREGAEKLASSQDIPLEVATFRMSPVAGHHLHSSPLGLTA